MPDVIFEDFLTTQRDAGLALAEESDLLDLEPLDGPPTQRYIATFRCKGLTLDAGRIVERDHWMLHINMYDDYLRRVEPGRVLTVLTPIFHPNAKGPGICLGSGVRPGMSLVDMLFQVFEIICYQNVVPHDGMNEAACAWARQHMDRFPIDDRPLKTRLPDTASGAA